jgi:hypothetical protein
MTAVTDACLNGHLSGTGTNVNMHELGEVTIDRVCMNYNAAYSGTEDMDKTHIGTSTDIEKV